ncbi:MAG: CoA-binding protein [Burkholderiaceae bacterium]|nr:CoA-binding protein [Burkholderiaceae bacterium]
MIIDDDQHIGEVLKTVKTIAVVGCSPKEGSPKCYVPAFLQSCGYRVIPVNPMYDSVLGEKCYASLRDIPERIDMVECFRPSADIPPLAEDAIAVGAKVLWMQIGVINHEAAQRASASGLTVVMNRCPREEIPRMFPEGFSVASPQMP